MQTYNLYRQFALNVKLTDKVTSVMRMFGLTTEKLTEQNTTHKCSLKIKPGDIVYITGPSGSGKTVLLNELEDKIKQNDRINLSQVELPDNKALIDCIDDDYLGGLRFLSTAGLNDCFCVLNSPARLSEGQKWRFKLAVALSAKKKFIFIDEFCSQLDRITAAVISYNVHRFAEKHNVTFVLASSHDDTLTDLLPDVLVIKNLSGPAQVIYKQKR